MNKSRITAIIVAYLPDSRIIADAIESIYGQVSELLIIDNTPGGSGVFQDYKLLDGENNIELITLNKNVGIAQSQNIGIAKALENGAEFVLLSDQDTHYPNNYIARMLDAYSVMIKKEKVGAIAPDFFELNRKERQGFVLFDSIFSKRIYPQSGCHKITQAITSGEIIPSKVFDTVGFMNEELFIDWVDIEWCWRARAEGYAIIGCADVVIQHSLGDVAERVGSKSYLIRSPIRHYYIIRNGVYLALKNKTITFGMRINLLAKSARYLIEFAILGKPHWKHFAYSMKGFYHGITNQLGVYR